jgi:putative oxidoreductase
MLASIFIVQGYDTLRHPEKVAPRADKVVGPLKERVSALPDDTEQLVRINGAVQLVAGSLLAIGRFPRLSALALAATLVPTTLAGHPYWETKDEKERAQQRVHFLKNLTMLGGLLIAAADTEGNPSLAWRSRHAVQAARHDVSLATQTAKASGKAGVAVGTTLGKAQGTADLAQAKADLALARAGQIRAERTGEVRARAGKAAHKASIKAAKTAGKASAKAAKAATKASAKAAKTTGKVGVKAGRTQEKAAQLASRLPVG